MDLILLFWVSTKQTKTAIHVNLKLETGKQKLYPWKEKICSNEWFINSVNEFRCYEVKQRKVKKAGSRWESSPGHLWLEPPVLCRWATTTEQPPTLTVLYMYCTGGTECLSRTHGSHSVCAVRTLLGVDRKIVSIRKEPMLSGFLTLNAESILPNTGNKWI